MLSPELMPFSAREQARMRANMRLLRPNGSSHSVFGDLPPSQLRAVAKLFNFIFAPAGAYVMRQGEAKDSFYELVAGEAAVIVEKFYNRKVAGGSAQTESQDIVVDVVTEHSEYRHFGDGGFTSWMENSHKIGSNRRNASIIAQQPCWLLEMPPQHFTALYDIVPSILARFRMAKEVQQRSHVLKSEQLNEESTRRMLAEHKDRADERDKLFEGSRQARLARAGRDGNTRLQLLQA
ncbi:hypothetical protein T492DRAFT_301605 [Pavlovales sp. CCMP2436]|nr:hypothetical protein T492DRAFT_301605 [Pavlovales sp. CCMP2436]